MRADAGVVISASHNPYQDNGIKIFAADGFKLPDDVEADIERRMERDPGHAAPGPAPDASARRSASTTPTAATCSSSSTAFPKERTLDGMQGRRRLRERRRLPGRAAGVRGAGRRGHRAGGRARRPQHQRRLRGAPPGARWPPRCGAPGAPLGIALDGDADRVILADEHGQRRRRRSDHGHPGHAHAGQGQLPGETVVATVMSNLGLERALASRGRQAAAHGGRRSLRRRGDARARLHLRRRAVGAHHLPRPRDHRRRHAGGAARAGGDGRRRGGRCRSWRRAMTRYPQVLLNFAVARKAPVRGDADGRGRDRQRREARWAPTGAWWCATRAPSPRRA